MTAGSKGLQPDEWLNCSYTQELLRRVEKRLDVLPVEAMNSMDTENILDIRGRFSEAKSIKSTIIDIGHGG